MASCLAIKLFEQFYQTSESDAIYQYFLQQHDWPDNRYVYASREFVLPRLQTWHADAGIQYSYSNNLLQTRDWTPLLSAIRDKVQSYLQLDFNSVLVNYYRDGEDYVGWHADNEPELGDNPYIASISFGAERVFAFKHKVTGEISQLKLDHGCLLLMMPEFQQQWLHSVPKDQTVTSGRINLTFRRVLKGLA